MGSDGVLTPLMMCCLQLISKITDKLLPTITEWRNQPLESFYGIVYLDAMFFKARDNGRVVTKAVYNILGIDQNGHKDILGFYVAESEGAHFCFWRKFKIYEEIIKE